MVLHDHCLSKLLMGRGIPRRESCSMWEQRMAWMRRSQS